MSGTSDLEKRTDHRGHVFKSVVEMAEYYGIDFYTYSQRIHRGWDKKRALTEKVSKTSTESMTDHLGNRYGSIIEMCNHYNINYSTYKDRLNSGMSKKDALTADKAVNRVEDHLGNIYPSKVKMCEAYNINYHTFKGRMQTGMSIKDALTKPLAGSRYT